MSYITAYPEIKDIDFLDDHQMIVHLSNERSFIVPLDKFPSIQRMDKADKSDFEIIDGTHLSFLALDEIFPVQELMGI